jgi:hypothetical protein
MGCCTTRKKIFVSNYIVVYSNVMMFDGSRKGTFFHWELKVMDDRQRPLLCYIENETLNSGFDYVLSVYIIDGCSFF